MATKYKRKPNCNCKICDLPIYKRPQEIKNNSGLFCSKKCYGQNIKKEKPCSVCAKPILSKLNKKTCSKQCYEIHKIKHNKERTWGLGKRNQEKVTTKQARKKLIIERGSCCQICGFNVKEILNLHHIVEKSSGGLDIKSNLIVVCPNCHASIHAKIIKIS